MLCDMCNKEIKREDGYLLITSQVVFSTRYWSHLYDNIESGGASISIQQLEKLLPMQIQKMAGMSTDWLICENCMGILDSSFMQRKEVLPEQDWRTVDLEQPYKKVTTSPWSSGPTDLTRTGTAAVKAWEMKFGKKPNVSNLAIMVSLTEGAVKDYYAEKKTEQDALRQKKDINSGNKNLEQLEDILKNANSQLEKYNQAKSSIIKAGITNWKYEIYTESLRIGSSGDAKPITRKEWENLHIKDRIKLRESVIASIHKGQQNLKRIIAAPETELDRQKEKMNKSISATKKKWWHFWK